MESSEDIISVLTHDHREVEELFGKIERAASPQDRRDLTEQVIAELVRHSVAEEEYLYPAFRDFVPAGDALADKELADHATVEEGLKALEELDVNDSAFMVKFGEVSREVRAHVLEEEGELFPRLREHTRAEDLEELGRKVTRAKKMAPTRPHPAAPDTPPLNKILAPGAGLVDRIRDKLTHRST